MVQFLSIVAVASADCHLRQPQWQYTVGKCPVTCGQGVSRIEARCSTGSDADCVRAVGQPNGDSVPCRLMPCPARPPVKAPTCGKGRDLGPVRTFAKTTNVTDWWQRLFGELRIDQTEEVLPCARKLNVVDSLVEVIREHFGGNVFAQRLEPREIPKCMRTAERFQKTFPEVLGTKVNDVITTFVNSLFREPKTICGTNRERSLEQLWNVVDKKEPFVCGSTSVGFLNELVDETFAWLADDSITWDMYVRNLIGNRFNRATVPAPKYETTYETPLFISWLDNAIEKLMTTFPERKFSFLKGLKLGGEAWNQDGLLLESESSDWLEEFLEDLA